jgi:hypothetical protein
LKSGFTAFKSYSSNLLLNGRREGGDGALSMTDLSDELNLVECIFEEGVSPVQVGTFLFCFACAAQEWLDLSKARPFFDVPSLSSCARNWLKGDAPVE